MEEQNLIPKKEKDKASILKNLIIGNQAVEKEFIDVLFCAYE